MTLATSLSHGQHAVCSNLKQTATDSPPLHLATELYQLVISNPLDQIPEPPLAEERSPIPFLGVVLDCRSAAREDRESVLLRSGYRSKVKFGDEFGEAALVLIGAEAVEVCR